MSAADTIVIATKADDFIYREGDRPDAIIPLSMNGRLHAGTHCGAINVALHEVGDERVVVLAMSVPGSAAALYQQLDVDGATELAAAIYRTAGLVTRS